jgi:hypothetical protein
MKALRIVLVGLLGAVAAFLAVVGYKVSTAPPPPQTGVLVIALPGIWLLVLTSAGFIGGGAWQLRRERRRNMLDE